MRLSRVRYFSTISTIGQLRKAIVEERYSEASNIITILKASRCREPELLLFEGICLYESGDDLNCLRLLTRFIKLAPNHTNRDYGAFTASICLMNLGLDEEAFSLIEKLPKSYPDRDKEIRNLKKLFKNRTKARIHANAIKEAL